VNAPIAPNWLAKGYLLLFALLPWSLECIFGAWRIHLPSEPLIAALGCGLAWVVWRQPAAVARAFSQHSLLQISAAWVGWLAISACFSSMKIVSWKYWLVESAHWWVFGVGVAIFPFWWPRLLRAFAFSMAGVVIYTVARHAVFFHFRADQAMLAPMPFLRDHTLYAAILAVLVFALPPGEAFFSRKWAGLKIALSDRPFRALFVLALLISTCRAAALSLLLAASVWAMFFFGKKGRLALAVGLLALLSGLFFQEKIQHALRHDVSSLERLNRWACAFRMARERPLAGFGPGTFQFQYLDFQHVDEMTRISTPPGIRREPTVYGRGGGAHSEFWQALAEAGWVGLALWAALVVAALWAGLWRRDTRLLALGLLTFFAHGAVNNFLHDGRMAALVWGSVAVLGARMAQPPKNVS
jgi:putative inorganic carbon (hco3(-)) transporter